MADYRFLYSSLGTGTKKGCKLESNELCDLDINPIWPFTYNADHLLRYNPLNIDSIALNKFCHHMINPLERHTKKWVSLSSQLLDEFEIKCNNN